MRIGPKALRFTEQGLFVLGLLLLIIFSLAHIHRFVLSRAEMKNIEGNRLKLDEGTRLGEGVISESSVRRLDLRENAEPLPTAPQRAKLYQANFDVSDQALAVLRIPRLRLEAPVLEGTDALTLNRGVGRISGTSRLGENGNVGIAGHRDGFFRPLKEINPGDLIELVRRSGTDIYKVDRISITDPTDVSVLQPENKPKLTLVTCHPFYYVGPAPKRYIVEASLKR